ncbi:MAG: 50S ribosomal protein L9 [Rhodospirillaceae bacterium]|nr:50S ribosomal protein L9 [Rhodospirillaceae bacterium]
MEVILLERIERLGQMGDVVNVKPGYARNFLLPQNKALRATKANLSLFESQRVQIEASNLKRREEAEAVAAKMDGLRLVIVRQAAESGQLYGSVTARDIRDAIRGAGFSVEKAQAQLNQPIKALGTYAVPFSLHPEVKIDVAVIVARSEEEAEIAARALAKTADVEDEAEIEEVEAETVAEEVEDAEAE